MREGVRVMRGRGVAILAAALSPGFAFADPPPAKPPPLAAAPAAAPVPQPSPDKPADDSSFYPAAARAAGVEGDAVIHCDRNEHLALKNCTQVSETPAGQGFGAAALAIAARSPDNPKVNLTDASVRPPVSFTVHFRLHPPGVYPDLTQMGHTLVQPALVTAPTRAQIQAAYPVRALADQIDGAAILDCLVTDRGLLAKCVITGETPVGYGFGAAALDLVGDFVLKPRLIDGDPIGGAEVRVPVEFQAHDPSAPLELKTNPSQ